VTATRNARFMRSYSWIFFKANPEPLQQDGGGSRDIDELAIPSIGIATVASAASITQARRRRALHQRPKSPETSARAPLAEHRE
jgi:hypothetical protein